ncbi:MAG: LytTR family DNA-binding domain-containing protein [Lachnospiraceae bacterium]|nr:LytTR family DNA-binding domain-containing protein [Lachnospiraceae bacterium]
MLIAICDDDGIWREQAGTIITEFAKENGIDIELHSFGSDEEMFARMSHSPDVLFLDIRLDGGNGEKNGITVAGQVNERWVDCQIVYLTEYLEFATYAYRTDHVYYMVKNEFADRIGEIFQKILRKQESGRQRLSFSLHKGGALNLYPREIFCFERKMRLTEIHTVSGDWLVNENLQDLMKRLPANEFVRCHNSFIVFFPAVQVYQKNYFQLKDGTRVDISRSYGKQVQDAFLRWARTQMDG